MDLNLCHNQVSDLSALDNVPLERFYCSYNPVSEEEIARFEQQHPDCATNWLVYSSTRRPSGGKATNMTSTAGCSFTAFGNRFRSLKVPRATCGARKSMVK